jgi:hypothetical protein
MVQRSRIAKRGQSPDRDLSQKGVISRISRTVGTFHEILYDGKVQVGSTLQSMQSEVVAIRAALSLSSGTLSSQTGEAKNYALSYCVIPHDEVSKPVVELSTPTSLTTELTKVNSPVANLLFKGRFLKPVYISTR